jgi:uncharacterized protein YjbI with pentapeptide repeats
LNLGAGGTLLSDVRGLHRRIGVIMSAVFPQRTTVRPRVIAKGMREARLAEDVIAELADEMPEGIIEISGRRGSGKSMAVSHLAAVLGDHPRLVFLDEPTPAELDIPNGMIAVASDLPAPVKHSSVELKLVAWGFDELVEYLLAMHHDACVSVIARLGDAAHQNWAPPVATVVLERFVADDRAPDVPAELVAHVRERVERDDAWEALCHFCLTATATNDTSKFWDAIKLLGNVVCPYDVRQLVAHDEIRWPLAVEYAATGIMVGDCEGLECVLPEKFLAAVAERCRGSRTARVALKRALRPPCETAQQAMAASILFTMEAGWRPKARRRAPWRLDRGYFRGAQWAGVDLQDATLFSADLTEAHLENASFEQSKIQGACFDRANLLHANLVRCRALNASFQGATLAHAKLWDVKCAFASFFDADLSGASLVSGDFAKADFSRARLNGATLMHANLTDAKLEDTDLTNAVLRGARLIRVDLRTARLQGACLEGAALAQAQMEDIHWPDAKLLGADLHRAHLTGSRLPRADLRGANFSEAGLAEIEWEDADLRRADLRRATFHMGSSRSGLVGSPIACEGSKTGFYTDDYEDMNFKHPEEIRKANLCGADLRGARIDGLDFYLVDLRDAKLDEDQLAHVRRCGAILGTVLT